MKQTNNEDDIHVINLQKGRESFSYFIENIYPKSFKPTFYVHAPHITEWAERIGSHKRTATLSARKHLKSTTMYAFVMWLIFRMQPNERQRWLYMSFNQHMSIYHTKNIKDLIRTNIYFGNIKDRSPTSGELRYSWGNGDSFEMIPQGILTFFLGWHGDGIVCDDILLDPTSEMDFGIINKINRVFMEKVMSLPREEGQIHLVGTAQHQSDLFFKLKDNPTWNWGEYKAILNEINHEVLWPQLFNYERLIQIRDQEIGEKAFSKEYMCVLKGTKIIIKNGFKKIEEINKNDEVLGNGNFIKVKQRFDTKSNELINIKFKSIRELNITPNHPILIIKQKYKRWLKGKEKKRELKNYGFYHIPTKHGFDKEWKEAKDIQRGDIVCFPRPKEYKKIDISNEKLELIGWYISEGFSNLYNKQWMLGIAKKQQDIKEHIKNLIKIVWNYDARLTNFEVVINKKEGNNICKYYYDNFGHNAYQKKLPEWFFDLTKEQFFIFFDSLFQGDGHHKKNYYIYTTNSEVLAIQLKTLLRKFGILVNVTKNSKQYVLRWCDNPLYCWMDNDYFYERVLQVNKLKGEFETYNLQTDDETYCTEHCLVHNCSPVWSEEAFFKRDELYKAVDKELQELKELNKEYKSQVLAGLDIGMKTHPSHFTIFVNNKGIYTQIFEKFMDGWDYSRQVDFINNLIEVYKIDQIYYDDTRSELSGFKSRGIISSNVWKPIVFTLKTKYDMASNFSRLVNYKENGVDMSKVKLLNRQRMIDSILSVSNELKAPESEIGHGDAFWSIALALYKERTYKPYIAI